MNDDAQPRFNARALFLCFILLLVRGHTSSQPASNQHLNERAAKAQRFIVAFELSPEKEFAFTWPYESMRPATYQTVLMKVKRMPRITDKRGAQSRTLLASQCLKVNGALQRPLRLKPNESEEQFAVRLDQGRLRFSLVIPAETTLDPQYQNVRIELYEIPASRLP